MEGGREGGRGKKRKEGKKEYYLLDKARVMPLIDIS